MSAPLDRPTVVLDTSVIVKWVRREEALAAEALSWFTRLLEGDLRIAVPSLLAYELANVLVYKADLTTDQIVAVIQSLYDIGLDWFEPSPTLISRAAVLAREFNVTLYDAAFAALAEALNADMITADAKAARQLQALPFMRFLGDDT